MQYLVEREQAGESEKLKGYSIAVDVFGRDSGFDPSTDTVVRVQAGRLRELLQQYFTTEGASDPVRIVIPRGSYAPTYELNGIALPAAVEIDETPPAPVAPSHEFPPQPEAAPAVSPSLMLQVRLFWLAIGVVIAMLGVLILRQGETVNAAADSPSGVESGVATGSILSSAALEALPVVYLASSGGADVGRVAAAMRTGLSGFDTVDFIGRDVPANRDQSADSTSFAFSVHTGPSPGGVTIELQNVASGRVLLSRNLTASEIASPRMEDRIAGILSDTVPASGTIYSYIQQAGIRKGLTACLLLNDDYYLDQNDRTFQVAYQCFETLANRGSNSPLAYSELAVLNLEAVTDHYASLKTASADEAIALAHKAIQMGATSPYAARAYGYVNSRLGNAEEATRWMRKAYELNTYDLGMAAAYGYALIFAGNYAQGTPIMLRAVDASNAHPTWWDYGLFLGSLMLNDHDTAGRATRSLATTVAKEHYLAAQLIVARWSGDEADATALLDELRAKFPKFAANPGAVFAERKYPADLTARLIEALREAGLGSSS